MIRNRLLSTTILIAAALSACSPSPETSFANGREAFAANDYRGARVALISGLREKPDDHEMRVLLARTQIALGDGEGATSTLAKLPKEMTDRPDVAAVAGEAEVLRGQYDKGIALVDGLETGAADRVRALAYIGLGEVDKAAEAFAAGAGRAAPDASLLASYARFSLLQGEAAKADALVGRALKLDPRMVEAHLVRADMRLARNELPGALASFDRVLELHPANFDGRVGKAEVLISLGRLKDAEPLAASLSEEAPDEQSVIFLSARLAGKQGDWAKVRSILQPHEDELRVNPVVTALYGRALIELDQPAVALGVLEPSLKRHGGSRALRRLVVRAQLASRDPAGALATIRPLASRPDATPEELKLASLAAKGAGSDGAASFEKRLSTPSPEWIGGELAKADRALRNRQWSDAESLYQSILTRTGGENAMVLNNLAFAKQQLGKDSEALDMALRAVKLEPENASILDTAGWMLVQSGSKARGLEMLRRAAKLDPDNRTIARHLGQAEAS
ncbi:tetratricopeptide repeat protein [Qipengyuania soli]|uniref:Tetratricopeptide repeat protein n=1 Tax=Qipengyuania soli TaxID=2782568 RepID=A0A7S8F6G8_9SPHN|nr:tetratricopeptide repeat protein [Qipengyuania soli]QPC99952.1 tetratricopeptide repeat protein [Qipengyuania soli]